MAQANALAAAQTILMNVDSCGHCGKSVASSKHCSRCKRVFYCGGECQKAGWKAHKKVCEPPLALEDVVPFIRVKSDAGDWRAVIDSEWRFEDLMRAHVDNHNWLLSVFFHAHELGRASSLGNDVAHNEHALACVRLGVRRCDLLFERQRFRDQCEVLFSIANNLASMNMTEAAMECYQQARSIGETNGFLSAECQSCLGLGALAVLSGDNERGLELLRNALAAAPLDESGNSLWELRTLEELIEALFSIKTIDILDHPFDDAADELGSLIKRYTETAKVESERVGYIFHCMHAMVFTIQLHEVVPQPCHGSDV
jgi:tetratricopeptide (TPR) repeat protein